MIERNSPEALERDVKAHTGNDVTPSYLAGALWRLGWRNTGMTAQDALDLAADLDEPVAEYHAHDWFQSAPLLFECRICGEVMHP